MSMDENWRRGPKTPTRNRPHGNLLALRVAVLGLFAILAAQLFRMQIIDGADYAQRSRENHVVQKYQLPTRGIIYDRNGEPLVVNVPVYAAVVLPEFLPDSEEERYRIYLQLEKLVNVPALEVQARVKAQEKAKRGYIEIAVKKYLTPEQAMALDEASTDMPGVSLSVKPGRSYTAGPEFSHILGYIGDQRQEDVERLQGQGYQQNESIGRNGVEAAYEKDLRGTRGVTAAEQDAQGRLIQSLKTKAAEPGNGVKLSIDAGLQKYISQLLEDSLPGDARNGDARVAAAVVMSATTGEILAQVSLPNYDNNIFSKPDEFEPEFNALLRDPRHPLLDQALTPSAPGSTFKLVTASAALETGRATPATSRFIPKVLEVKGENGVIYPLVDWRAHGELNLTDAIAWSSNIYMFMISCGILNESRGLGKNAEDSAVILGYYARQFGFGDTTGLDIGGDASGIIPSPTWKRQVHADDNPEDREWYYADTCFMGIGQGDVLATPLQVTRMTAAVANGGKLLKPHVAKEIVDLDGKTIRTIKPEWKQIAVSAANLAVVRQGMHESVGVGAGILAQQPGLDIGGKTGTAEFFLPNGNKAQHAWFTGFFPFNDPEYVVTVYFDRGIGGEKAAPIAGRIMSYINSEVTK